MLFSQEVINQKLAELNAAWHACAATAYDHTLTEMQQAVERLDVAQEWFDKRNIKLDYDGAIGDHSLAAEQPQWRLPHQAPPTFAERLEQLERLRRMNSRW